MLLGREVVSCWAGFRPSAGASELCTDKTGSTATSFKTQKLRQNTLHSGVSLTEIHYVFT